MRMVLADKSAAGGAGVTSERLINLYPAPEAEGSESGLALYSVPGTRDFATLAGAFLRAMCEVEGTLYVISVGGLYSVAQNGTPTYLAAVSDGAETTMTGHRSSVTIASDDSYLV